MARLRYVFVAVLGVALTCAAMTPANAAIDVSAPTLASFTFTPSSVNVTGGPDQIVISARLTDATAVVPPDFTVDSDATTQVLAGTMTRTSGTAQDGIYSATVVVPASAAAGTWTVAIGTLADTVGNADSAAHNHATKLTVTNGASDTAAPTLASFSYTPNSPATLNVTTGPKQVTVTARLIDATGAVAPTAKVSSDSSTQSATGSLTRVSGTAQDGTYQGTVDIPSTAAPGAWTVSLNALSDTVGNRGAATNHVTKLTVVSNATDVSAPALASFSYSPTSVDASVDVGNPAGGADIVVEARVTDASGADPPVAILSSDTTAQSVRATLTLWSGSPQDGRYRGTVSLPGTAAPGTWTVALDELRDLLGNTDRTVHRHATKLTVVNDDSPRAPSAPTGVSAVRGDQSAQVSWTAAAPNRSPITGYTITASPGGATQTVGGSATTGVVTGLINGISYTFSVKATNAVGTSPPSAPSAAVTPAGIPTAPTGVTALRGDRSAQVSWDLPVVNGSPITSYTITISPGGATQTIPGGQTFGTVTGLTNGSTYSFTVKATNAIGTSPASASSNTVVPGPVPNPPATVTAVRGDKSAQVSWSAVAGSVTGYIVTATPGGSTKTVSGSTLTTAMTDLTNGTAYTFTVQATNASGTSPFSTPSAAVTPAAAPAAPVTVTAVRGDKSAEVTWSPATDNGAPITTYTVTANPGGAFQTIPGTATTATFTGLTNGVAYTFTVRSTNAIGTSPASAASTPVTPAAAPAAPTGVVAVRGNLTAEVSWTAPDANGAPITGYTVTTNPGGATTSVVGPASSAVVTGLSNSATYTFTVTATNAIGTSPVSAPSPAIGPASAPSAPTGVAATRGDASARISWTAPASNGAPITSYLVTASPGGATTSVSGTATSAIVGGLTNGSAYTFTVRAVNAIGTSPASLSSDSLVPAGAPGRVALPKASVKKRTVTIRWKAPVANGAAITGYVVSAARGPRATVSRSARKVRFTGLKKGTYLFVVTARNEIGLGTASRSVKVRIR